MALVLNLPVLNDNPVIRAETSSQKVIEYLENLQTQSIQVGSSSLLRQLVELNRQKIAPKIRIPILDLYSPVVMRVTEILAESYLNTTLPLAGAVKAAAKMVESLWQELGFGYKLAFVDLQNQLIKTGKTSAYCIQSAMQAIAEYMLTFYQTYTTPPYHVWSDLHQLYFCAVQLKLQQSSVAEGKNEKIKNHAIAPTIESTYKRALLIFLADTQRLTPKNIRLTIDLLAAHVNKVQISAVAPLESTAASFIIHLQSNEAPTPYSKQATAPDPLSDILLLTIDLVKALHVHLNRLLNYQLASESRGNEIDLLTHLIKHWGISPKRIFRRLAKNGDLELVEGISAIHLINNITSAFNNQSKPLTTSRWQILNISATGLSIRRHPTAEKNTRIGSLIATKNKDEKQWSLGVVRWANCGMRDKVDIGVQLIAPHIKSATAIFDKCEHNDAVLVIEPNNANKIGASIIAPRGVFEPSRTLILNVGNTTQQAVMTKLIDRTDHFEQIQYEFVE
ncbi:MAG: hypothetical protein WBP13_10960 [Methylophilaceae bacterium]